MLEVICVRNVFESLILYFVNYFLPYFTLIIAFPRPGFHFRKKSTATNIVYIILHIRISRPCNLLHYYIRPLTTIIIVRSPATPVAICRWSQDAEEKPINQKYALEDGTVLNRSPDAGVAKSCPRPPCRGESTTRAAGT